MKELSIFIDESGDFGRYEKHSPYYIMTMVFHNQEDNLIEHIMNLENQLVLIGFHNHCIHTGPIIRNENEYYNNSIKIRKKLLMKMISFIRKINIQSKSFVVSKKNVKNRFELINILEKQTKDFFIDNYNYFLTFDIIKIYYDDGQSELSKMLLSIFHELFNNVEFKKIIPSQYRLFQVADFICTMTLIEEKLRSKQLSKSDILLFDNERTLKRNYLRVLKAKKFDG